MPKKPEETKTTEVAVAADVVVVKKEVALPVVQSEKAIAVANAYGLTPGMPAPGMEQVEKEDLMIPRLKAIQAMSREAQADDEKDNIPLGTLYNMGTGDSYVPRGKKLQLIALACLKQRAMFEDGRLKYRSLDGKVHDPESPGGARDDDIVECAHCPDARWIEKEPPECGLQYAYPVLVLDKDSKEFREPGPMLLILSRSNVPTAKKINGIAAWTDPPLPLFAFVLNIWTRMTENDKGKFYVIEASRAERLEPGDERYQQAKGVYGALAGRTIVTAEDDDGDDESF